MRSDTTATGNHTDRLHIPNRMHTHKSNSQLDQKCSSSRLRFWNKRWESLDLELIGFVWPFGNGTLES